ncbi:MAG: hypothetical protein DMF56_27760 [Acidobacteria bacterium]|nr:MAG: hypothetical protein DMF56_27760 [Acidobacteriota bacterium]
MRSKLAEQLRKDTDEMVRQMSVDERLEFALSLGDTVIETFARSRGIPTTRRFGCFRRRSDTVVATRVVSRRWMSKTRLFVDLVSHLERKEISAALKGAAAMAPHGGVGLCILEWRHG